MVLRKSHVRGGVCYFCGVIRNGLLFLLMFIAYGYKMDYHAIVEMCVLHFKRFERFLAERGRGMRKVDLIVVHCSATPPGVSLSPQDLEREHRRRGFDGCGYHYYVRRDGLICSMRPVERPGAHAKGFNATSIGVCYEGGLDADGRPADTRTPQQRHSLRVLVRVLLQDFPGCRVTGHRDLSPDRNGNGVVEPEEWLKACPCFDVQGERFWE